MACGQIAPSCEPLMSSANQACVKVFLTLKSHFRQRKIKQFKNMNDYTVKHHQNQKLLAGSRHDIMLIFHHIRVRTYLTRLRRVIYTSSNLLHFMKTKFVSASIRYGHKNVLISYYGSYSVVK